MNSMIKYLYEYILVEGDIVGKQTATDNGLIVFHMIDNTCDHPLHYNIIIKGRDG